MIRLERVAGWLSDVFGIDTRSLAVFRIGLALTILLDLVLRAQDLGAHYTDAGVLPRRCSRLRSVRAYRGHRSYLT